MTQPDLFTTTKAPNVSQAQIDRVIAYLGSHVWVKRAVIAQALGISVRRVRLAGEHSHGQIVSGPKGLGLAWRIPGPEAEHAARIFESQARTGHRRAAEIRRAMHRRPLQKAAS